MNFKAGLYFCKIVATQSTHVYVKVFLFVELFIESSLKSKLIPGRYHDSFKPAFFAPFSAKYSLLWEQREIFLTNMCPVPGLNFVNFEKRLMCFFLRSIPRNSDVLEAIFYEYAERIMTLKFAITLTA